MLVKHIVVEAGITYSKAGKLTGVSVRVSAALDGGGNQAKLK